jgi:5-methylcytosine-specific restriction enzyme subunit McrC
MTTDTAQAIADAAGSTLEVTQTFEAGRWQIKAGSHVGAVVAGDLRILVTPKVKAANLFHMLEAGGEPVPVQSEIFDYERTGDLLPAFATFFASVLDRAVARGLPRQYREIDERLIALRGRIDVKAQLKMGGLPIPVACRFDEHTADTPVNRIAKAALLVLLRLPGVSVATRQTLARLVIRFDEVSTATPGDLAAETPFTRLDEHFRSVDRLARLVLAGSSITNSAGLEGASTFMVNMNTVFESFLEASLRRALQGRLTVTGQRTRALDEDGKVGIKPDLTFLRGRRVVYVGDAKYKLIDSGLGLSSDYYQLLAYTTALDLPEGVLVYCQDAEAPVPPKVVTVRHAGKRLHSWALTLAGGPADLDREIDDLAAWITARSEPELKVGVCP